MRFVSLLFRGKRYNRDKEGFRQTIGKEAGALKIAEAIAKLRISGGLTQNDLAERLFVSRDLVSKWETGARRPDWHTIEKISGVFGVPPETIVKREELVFWELEMCLPDTGAEPAALSEALNVFLKGLDETEANLFIRRYYFLESAAKVAAAFGMKENRVRSTLSRTRKKLRRFLKGDPHEKHENV